jgi:hypothetical protein
MEAKVVVHLKGGTIHKGVTQDFDPAQEAFHLLPAEGGGVPLRIRVEDMKALFYVKDYLGNRDFVPRRAFGEAARPGRKAIVTFEDGEKMWGTIEANGEGPVGFYFLPEDEEDNNIRIFIVRSSVQGIEFVR